MKIPFSKVSISGNELKYISEVLASGWLTTSSKAMEFEKQFAQFVGAKYACAVNSCTSALHLAIEAVGIGPGDKVLIPSLTFTSSAEVIRYMNADPVFLDVDYDTRLITPDILKDAVEANPEAKALILVHYGGQAATMTTPEGEGILDICRKHGIALIEDAAHAFPTKYGGAFIGSFGDISCFSFYANKTITTGEGGMLVTDNEEVYKRSKIMRLHGINRDIWQRFTSNANSWEYDVVAPGFKYNMPDLNAAIGIAQLEKADYFRDERQRCASYYFKALQEVHVIDLPVFNGSMEDHSWHLFPIILKPECKISRNDFIRKMTEHGIGTSVHYKPLYRMTYYRDAYQLVPDNYPNSERIWKGLVSLPIYPDLGDADLEIICDTIRQIVNFSE